MRHHLPILSLFPPQACRPTTVALSTGSRTRLPFHISSFLSSSVTLPYTPFIFCFPLIIIRPKSLIHIPLSHFSLSISSSKLQACQFTLSLCPGLRKGLHCPIHPSLFTRISIPSLFHYLCHGLRPFAPWFTRSSSLFNYLCPGLRPFAHHGLHAAPAYYILSTPTLRLERNSSTISFTRGSIAMSGPSTTHLRPLYAL
ncbi:hypothetical protein EV702DRAFT_442497 [Suillus placidus]|uniref:Uncharacterized protein n=1 Tax=Suillus placidus TaxID=48579 RepID=A0A9P6ZSC2_9AGAM|nr:hypothetical protein EV702DRAFT_442497 [Suillus placidus]